MYYYLSVLITFFTRRFDDDWYSMIVIYLYLLFGIFITLCFYEKKERETEMLTGIINTHKPYHHHWWLIIIFAYFLADNLQTRNVCIRFILIRKTMKIFL